MAAAVSLSSGLSCSAPIPQPSLPGGSDIRLEGLNSSNLTIVNSGAGRFSADETEIGHLRIDGIGATTIEFFNSRVHTAGSPGTREAA